MQVFCNDHTHISFMALWSSSSQFMARVVSNDLVEVGGAFV